MHSGDFDLRRTGAEGARLPYEYHRYAELGPPALDTVTIAQRDAAPDSPIEQAVCRALQAQGLHIDTGGLLRLPH